MSTRRSMPRVLRPPLAAYAGAWTVLATVYIALYTVSGVPVFMALRGAIAVVVPNALLALVSLRLARRWPWNGERRWRQIIRVVPVVLALSLASTTGWLLLIAADGLITTGAVKLPSATLVVWQTVINSLIHIAACGIGYAWHTVEALRDAQDRAVRADGLRARAELALLRSQLQPHFVLNVLHALLGLVRRDPTRAEAALERLGDLLRFGQWVHQSGADFVPLSREWEFVRSYLDLEQVRLGERLCATMDADDRSLQALVPPFAVQPLVENAILHAVAPRISGGRVAVTARRSDGRLCVTVKDDGPGASESAIAASPRMGLRLLQERLAALYGGRARLDFASLAEGGFRVHLDLPDDPGAETA
jgi:histidine kinase/histidine kinase/DNA gyrase B/HSP90-like ATPase